MPPVILHPPVLVCPNGCGHRVVNRGAVALIAQGRVPVGANAATLHDCPTVAGMAVPMVPEGTRAEARANEREDMLGDDAGNVRVDADGRPIMSVEVVRDDGTDLAVFAPTASAKIGVT